MKTNQTGKIEPPPNEISQGDEADLLQATRNGGSIFNKEDMAKILEERLAKPNLESEASIISKNEPRQSISPEENKHTASSSPHNPSSPKFAGGISTHDMGICPPYVDYSETEGKKPTTSQTYTEQTEDQKYLIKDALTGAVYDIRTRDAATMLNEADQQLTKIESATEAKKPWEEWWKEKREINYQLLAAAERGDKEKILDIIDKEKHGDLAADINAKGLDGYTPLHFAVSEGHLEAAEILLKHGADIEAVTKSLATALHIACRRGSIKMIELLLNSACNLNAQERDGNTAAHILSENDCKEGLQKLLIKGPDLNIKNSSGQTAVDVAVSIEVMQVFETFAKHSDAGYSRTIVGDKILRTGRADMIKSLLFKGSIMTGGIGKEESKKYEPMKSGSPDHRAIALKMKTKTRIIKIIEASKKVEKPKSLEEDKSARNNKSKCPFPVVSPSGSSPVQPATAEAEETERIGPEDFLPLQLLGKGSFGEVYLVKYKTTGKLYAMKILNKRRVMAQNLIKYAKTERNIMSFMIHPFIVGLNFAFQTSEKLFMIMDYCPGGDLGHILQKERRLTEDRARTYAAEVLLALEDLHKREIIFRDLKPDNVVIDEDGHALLTDFGLSKEGVSDSISAKSFCGSVAYLAPEMLKRSGHGKAVDWYLLGVLIYEMLVGVPPYFTTNREQLFKNIQTAPLKLPMFLSTDAKQLLVLLLNRNPMKRLGSGPGDAEDIKRHPWFKAINWDLASKRGLKVIKPAKKGIPNGNISPDVFVESSKGENPIDGWEFVKRPAI